MALFFKISYFFSNVGGSAGTQEFSNASVLQQESSRDNLRNKLCT